jgi:hypothetical protein
VKLWSKWSSIFYFGTESKNIAGYYVVGSADLLDVIHGESQPIS